MTKLIDPMGWTYDPSRDTYAILNAKGLRKHNVNSIANGVYLIPGGGSSLNIQAANVDKSRNCVADNPNVTNSLTRGHWSHYVDVATSPYVKGRSNGTASKQVQAVLVLAAVGYGATVPHYYPANLLTAATLADAKSGDTTIMTRAALSAWIADNRARGQG